MYGPPLMVSRNTMPTRTLPRAVVPWVLDSGGFTELQHHGEWRMPPKEYAALVRRYADEVGNLQWAAPQDWMCEPLIINGGTVPGLTFAGTHLSVAEHQRRTVFNYLTLRFHAPDLPWIPVLQGWTRDDYMRCVDLYASFLDDFEAAPTIGVGSVCRRQATAEAADIFSSLHALGLNLHGFGLKTLGVATCWPYLKSADSLAWSLDARLAGQKGATCGRPNGRGGVVKSCGNCRHYALDWYARASSWRKPIQGALL